MFDSELQSETVNAASGHGTIRADSAVRAAFATVDDRTHVARVYECGSLRVRFPRGPSCEAVLLNTGGGITGGDQLDVRLSLGPGAAVVATSQAAEKLYRSDGPPAKIAVRANLADGARLDWLPQESILFDRVNVERTLDIDMAATARLTMLEALMLGRTAHGESLGDARWRDRWRIRRGNALVLAENVRLDGAISDQMQRPALGAGARCVATLVHVAPDAEWRLDEVRNALQNATSCCGCSAWNGMLVARFAAVELHKLRGEMVAAVMILTRAPMPRAWSC